MQKRIRLSANERKEQIINAAMQIFSKKGFQGTKTKDIAESAGVSEAMIFKLFKNKDELYSAIIKHNVHDHSKEISAMKFDISNFREVLKGFFLHVVESSEKDTSFLRLMLYSSLEDHKLSHIFMDTQLIQKKKGFTEAIENGIKEGEFREVDPILAGQIFEYIIGGYVIERFVLGINKNEHLNNSEVAETIVDILLNGLRKRN